MVAFPSLALKKNNNNKTKHLKWRLAGAHKFHSLGKDQPTVAQRAETTVAERYLTSYVCARFLKSPHTMPGQKHSQPTLTSLGQGCMCV